MSTDMQKVIKLLEELKNKIDSIESKIQEFEIIFDAADIIEEHIEEEENKYNTEWRKLRWRRSKQLLK